MSLAITRLNEPNNVVGIHYSSIYDSRTQALDDFVVVGRRDSVDLYSWDSSSCTLIPRRSIQIHEVMLDIKPFYPLELQGTWFIIATEGRALVVMGFRNLADEVIVRRLGLGEEGSATVKPATLCVDPGKFLSTLTNEGSVCIFPIHRDKDLGNFKRAFAGKSHQKLFKEMVQFTVSSHQGRTPISVESIESHYEDNTDVTLSVIHRDELYHHYHSYYTWDGKTFGQNYQIKFPEEISPLTIPLAQNFGNLFFGRTGMYIRRYDGMISRLTASGLDIEMVQTGMAKKPLKRPWKIVGSLLLNPIDLKCAKVLLISQDGFLYVTTIDIQVQDDDLGYPDSIDVHSWNIQRFDGNISPATRILKLTDTVFLTHSQQHGMTVLTLDFQKMTFTINDKRRGLPPILDVNVTGTISPKVQIIGGSSMHDGIISTDFKGYESQLVTALSTKLTIGSSAVWMFDDVCIVKHIEGTQIFQGNALKRIDSFHGLENVDGEILDLYLNTKQQLMVISEKGIYRDGDCIKEAPIVMGVFTKSGHPTYCTNKELTYNSQTYKLDPAEIACISASEHKGKHYIVLGDWNGGVRVFSDGSSTTLQVNGPSAHSVLCKPTKKGPQYFIGTSHGQMFCPNDCSYKWNLGSSPVTIVDCDQFIIAYNAENVVKLEFNANGVSTHLGYLPVEPPEALSFCEGRLVSVNEGIIGELQISQSLEVLQHEHSLGRLVRKCVNFKNYMNLSLFVTMTENFSTQHGKSLVQCQLEIIENNTFSTKSIYRFPPGVEVTDAVNLAYKTDVISTYDEPPVHVGVESFLSQCFAVSCVYHIQDSRGPPIEIFSIDRSGKIQHTASSGISKVSFYSLSSHANRLLIAGGEKVCAYQIEYSLEHSKFAINRVSDWVKVNPYVNIVKSVGPEVMLTTVVGSACRYRLVMKDEAQNKVIFKWSRADDEEFSMGKFPTSYDTFKGLTLSVDSTRTIRASIAGIYDGELLFTDQINVIKAVEFYNEKEGEGQELVSIMEGKGDCSPIPAFVMGSTSGGLYLVSIIAGDFSDELEKVTKKLAKTKGWSSPMYKDMDSRLFDGHYVRGHCNVKLAKLLSQCKLL